MNLGMSGYGIGVLVLCVGVLVGTGWGFDRRMTSEGTTSDQSKIRMRPAKFTKLTKLLRDIHSSH